MERFQYPEPIPEKEFIDKYGIRRAIYSPGLQKTAGLTEINNVALKLAYETLEDRIYELFQRCINLGHHPKVSK
jgi:hypothetical protein